MCSYIEKFSFPLSSLQFSLLGKCCSCYFLVTCSSATNLVTYILAFSTGLSLGRVQKRQDPP